MKNYFAFITLVALCSISSTFAGGLDLNLYYGSRYVGLGGNHVGLTGDAYAPFYNPAAMTSVEKAAIAIDSSTLVHQYEAPVGAHDSQRKSEWNIAPLFYTGGVYRLSDRIAVGLAFFPTALEGGKFTGVDYGAGAPGGLNASVLQGELSNLLVRLELAPSIAFKLVDHFSIGLSYRLAYTRFDTAAGKFFAGLPSGASQFQASYLNVSMDGWDANGLKMGAFLEKWNGLSAGLTYRLQVKPDLSGDASVSYYSTTASQFTTAQSVPSTMSPRIPAQLQAGVSYDWIPDTFMTAFTYEYTYSSSLNQISINVTGFGPQTTPLNDHDSHSFHGGAEYTFHLASQNKIVANYGMAFDTGATNSAFPNPLLPPAAVYVGYAGGARYEFDRSILGAALNYGYYSRYSTPDSSLTGAEFNGKYGLEVWLAVLDYQYKF